MLKKVLGYFEEGWEVIISDCLGDYVCEDAEEIEDAIIEDDDWLDIKVEVLEDVHQVIVSISNDE